ncbi:cephalosporin hydroxylase [Candidatus Uhrbacteria bacterium RIFCSPHIGHO2_12_FULL_57_11]|uniref:Cephalosporin hydroxylase n=2 Tax=Candidatus Uhriibacteriota TaxID=1752732 RepID=A0A1F7UN68_9BACT|nr:MAG: cephalosporin hydroxylase [Candidatus Uhrbacteria bacterium RIFCSPHIGHO2_02_FULL_57_19]OGL79712.1 MAG: cephalosporin hydroxylase [Candidatus Uhrbacteria bacterium RIFCSPHIGHO2_12_FULL_57_11]
MINAFHKFYYESGAWDRVAYLGVPTQKCPTDMWVYQELIHELKPDIVVECGTAFGGSALYLAHLMDAVGSGKLISIDINYKEKRPDHPRIAYLTGSSTAPEVLSQVRERIAGAGTVMVILDSDHSRDHVLAELRAYSPLVSLGSYLIVEDSNVNGHPADPAHGPGPMEALREFLDENRDFAVDRAREKFYLTFNPNGYLKRIR